MSATTTVGTTTPRAIFSCARWLFGVFSGMEEKVVVEPDTTLDGDEDPVGCEKGEVDDEDAKGDKVVWKTMELDVDCCT